MAMTDLFKKLEEAGFLPVPNKKAIYKKYGILKVQVLDRGTIYQFDFYLFYYGTCYDYHYQVSKNRIYLDPVYWRSAQEILNYIDQGRTGQILIEALVKHKMVNKK